MYTAIHGMCMFMSVQAILLCIQSLLSAQLWRFLRVHCMLHAQVSRTDANALIALDPVDLTVTRKFNYTSILPEAKVSRLCFMPLLLFPVLAMFCDHCNAAASTFPKGYCTQYINPGTWYARHALIGTSYTPAGYDICLACGEG